MLYSKAFAKTQKEIPADEQSKNAQLLIRAGFIAKEMSGVYALLPLGKRVSDKIQQIIREEMNAISGQELHLASLQNPEVWQATNRWDEEEMDVWFKTKLQNETELGLAATHEEPLTKIATKFVSSYKDLPFYVYQFQTKFRNELRAKSGILRGREFLMKDLYSFNADEKGLDEFYEQAKQAYFNIFERLGIGDQTFLTFASGGAFSKFSHEFQTLCSAGEDTIYLDRAKKLAVNREVYTDEVLSELGLKKDELEEVTAIEVGNIFKLKTKYSEPLGLLYTDKNGESKPVVMGSYGIGVGRALGTVVELSNDEKGIIWPESISPYQVHLVGIGMDNPPVKDKAFRIYTQLQKEKIEVLFDDREDASAGEKFATADLIGISYRLVVSSKTEDKVEVKRRDSETSTLMNLDEFVKSCLKCD